MIESVHTKKFVKKRKLTWKGSAKKKTNTNRHGGRGRANRLKSADVEEWDGGDAMSIRFREQRTTLVRKKEKKNEPGQ